MKLEMDNYEKSSKYVRKMNHKLQEQDPIDQLADSKRWFHLSYGSYFTLSQGCSQLCKFFECVQQRLALGMSSRLLPYDSV